MRSKQLTSDQTNQTPTPMGRPLNSVYCKAEDSELEISDLHRMHKLTSTEPNRQCETELITPASQQKAHRDTLNCTTHTKSEKLKSMQRLLAGLRPYGPFSLGTSLGKSWVPVPYRHTRHTWFSSKLKQTCAIYQQLTHQLNNEEDDQMVWQ